MFMGKGGRGVGERELMRLSLLTQFKIDFLLPFTGCRKVLRKMPQRVKIYIQGIIIINNYHNKLFTFFQLSEMNGKKVLGKKVLPHSFLSFHLTWLVRFQEKLLHEMFCKKLVQHLHYTCSCAE